MTLAEHEVTHGPLPGLSGRELIELVQRSGLRGRGGADFPTAVKLRAVAGRRSPTLVVNGSEIEPASAKDRLLLSRLPHLVIDGAVLAARAIPAHEVIVTIGEHRGALTAVDGALAFRGEDRVALALVAGPEGYVTPEETAVITHLERGVAKPTFVPPRPYERGLRGRPTLVCNPRRSHSSRLSLASARPGSASWALSELSRLLCWADEVRGRGACHHPDGAARFVSSAVTVFGHEFERHRRNRCTARSAGLPLGVPRGGNPDRRTTQPPIRRGR